jgi:hypothetical protein
MVVILLCVAVTCEISLRQIPREDPLGRDLLYLPSPEMLKIISLGNTGLAADVLYLWSIQYYSLFKPHERFLYLETIYDLITNLDPLFFDAYRIGALIMGIQVGGDQDVLQRKVQQLLDKGVRNLPGNCEMPEYAAWEMFMRYKDRAAALAYAEIAAECPDAPARIKRMVGVWRDKERVWGVDDSIAYWSEAVDEAKDDYERKMCLNHLYNAVFAKDKQGIQPLLEAYRDRYGSCAGGWGGLIRAGLIERVPLDFSGNAYGLDAEDCSLVAYKEIKEQ